MADVFWKGLQRKRAMVRTLTVTTAATGGTITVTVGGTKSVEVTPTTTNTTTTATEIAAACEASTEPEFEEITWASSTNTVTATGPDDGAPITVTKTDGGTNSTSITTTTAALSPHDVSDGANYAGGAAPANLDRLVLQDSNVSLLYNLAALTAVTFTVLRKSSFTGGVGLPDTNPAGYPEYRDTHLKPAGTAIEVEGSPFDQAGQFRFESTAGSAVTLTVRGGSPGAVGSEVVEVHGLPAASVLRVAGGSVAVAPKVGQVATLGTLTASNASLRVGSGVTLSGGPALTNVSASVLSSWSGTLALDGGDVSVGGAAAGVLQVDAGRVTWRSTGNPGNSPAVGSGATLDLSQAPATLTIGGTITLYAGATLDDGAGRGGNYSLQTVRCTLDEVRWVTSNGRTFAVS